MARPKRWKFEYNKGIQTVTLSSWKYFHDFIREELIDSSNYVFRGQKNDNWKIEPTLIRYSNSQHKKKYETILENQLENFKYSIRGRAKNLKDIIDIDNELWALGQHHGLFTPFLDFTESPYVSAFFAFHEKENETTYRVIYGLSLVSVQYRLKDYFEIFKPLTDHNQRLLSQGGLFLKFKEDSDLETIFSDVFAKEDKKVKLFKIRIPTKDRNMCLKFLNSMNINHNSLFPDMELSLIHI